jgi:hypothetical protein
MMVPVDEVRVLREKEQIAVAELCRHKQALIHMVPRFEYEFEKTEAARLRSEISRMQVAILQGYSWQDEMRCLSDQVHRMSSCIQAVRREMAGQRLGSDKLERLLQSILDVDSAAAASSSSVPSPSMNPVNLRVYSTDSRHQDVSPADQVSPPQRFGLKTPGNLDSLKAVHDDKHNNILQLRVASTIHTSQTVRLCLPSFPIQIHFVPK